MPITPRKSFNTLKRRGIQRFSGERRKRDQVAIVLGPVAKFKLPGESKNQWVGDVGMYLLVTYKYVNGQWVYGKFRNYWQIDATKIIKYARKNAKTAFYIPYGNLGTDGKVAREDFDARPPTKFKRS
jgi:hypothetical protein